jgi:hypothetical protein
VSTLLGVAVELRKSVRYRLPGRVSFLWERQDGLLQEGKGTIRDISDRSVFVTGDSVPERGAHIAMEVYFSFSEGSSARVQLHGEGTVVRVDKAEGSAKGFAATVVFQAESACGPAAVDPGKLH